jgi:hypothetical protein
VIKTLAPPSARDRARKRVLRFGFSLCLAAVAACVGEVDVGGPQLDDSGASPDNATGVNDASVGEGGSSQGLVQAEGYANGQVRCRADADCCAVFDGCVHEALVVGAADESTVLNLLAEYDTWASAPGASATCTSCTPPAVQVSCVQNKCIGTKVDPDSDSGVNLAPWRTNHCGSIHGAPLTNKTGSVFGC